MKKEELNFILPKNKKNSNYKNQKKGKLSQKNKTSSLCKNSQNSKIRKNQAQFLKIEARRICSLIDCIIEKLPISYSIKAFIKGLKGKKKIKAWDLVINQKLEEVKQYEIRR